MDVALHTLIHNRCAYEIAVAAEVLLEEPGICLAVPNQCMASEADVVSGAEVQDGRCALAELHLDICVGGAVLNDSSIGLCLVLTFNNVAVLEDVSCDTGLINSVRVEDVSAEEVVCELVLEALAGRSSICGVLFLVSSYQQVVECEIIS